MSDFRVGITIRRPRPEVASVIFDVHYLPAWLHGVKEVAVTAGTPPAVGSILVLGKDEYEIVEFQRDLTLAMESDQRTLTFALEGVAVGTLVWLDMETDRGWLGRLLRPLLTWRGRRAAISDLRRLKQFIESREYRTWWADDGAAEET